MVARIVFMGSPEFAVPSLNALCEMGSTVFVVTQPDRKKGRGQKTSASPVKQAALKHGLEVWQPVSLRNSEAIQRLRTFQPDVYVTAAIGYILTPKVLSVPRYGCLNVHASLLPRWRGASPISAAILHGDVESGITIMKTVQQLDSGPILAQARCPIRPDDTTSTLTHRLSHLGADLLGQTLLRWLAAEITAQPQPQEGVTYCQRLQRQDGLIDWSRSAISIERMVRAYVPWPGTYTIYKGTNLKILDATILPDWSGKEQPGKVIAVNKDIAVATGHGALLLRKIQLAGKRAMTPDVFCQGQSEFIGSDLGK
ncbi:MAG: methionyl-tRNA formyltransferase [Anaerolineae bacterium]|nr:methionyl-tRNA formyltransferase [Anaerolineae bacterium]